jgi:hypothetical protein
MNPARRIPAAPKSNLVKVPANLSPSGLADTQLLHSITLTIPRHIS